MAISNNFTSTDASLYLNFARSRQLDPRISFSRASTGTYIDAEGILRTAGVNEPRFNYENGVCKGLLVESQKTNTFTSNNAYQYRFINNEVGVWQNALGASNDNTTWNGSNATVTTNLPDGTQGLAVRTTLTGSNGNASFQFDGINYTSGALSTFIRANKDCSIGWGTENNYKSFDLKANIWTRVYSDLSSSPWSSAIRNLRANDRVSNISGGYPVTFDLCFVQQESGPVTSYIPTSGSTATRAPDLVTINDLSWFNDTEGTFVVDTNSGITTTTTLFSGDDGTSQIIGYSNQRIKVGAGKTLYSTLSETEDTTRILSYSQIKNVVIASSSNEPAFFSTITGISSNISRMNIGYDPLVSNSQINGELKSFRYYPTQVSDTQLQSLVRKEQNLYDTANSYVIYNSISGYIEGFSASDTSVSKDTLSSSLLGKRYTGYFSDNLNYFTNDKLQGDTNTTTSIDSFSSTSDYYSWMWLGYFYAPVEGLYTFYTYSDDASYLWIGKNAISGYTRRNCLVDNGNLHAPYETKGDKVFLSAGYTYPLRIMFGENAGQDIMTVSFTPPVGTKTTNGSGYYFGGTYAWSNW
jgi:hypothetical protein